MTFLTREVRAWLYGIALGAILAPTLALTHLTPKEDDPT